MAKIDMILSRLDKVRCNGVGRYMACCPAHDDKSPSLLITEAQDGKIGIHCFANCGGADVLAAIGMNFSDLYPDDLRQDFKGLRVWQIRDLNSELQKERLIVDMALSDQKRRIPISLDDKARVKQAIERIKTIKLRLKNNE